MTKAAKEITSGRAAPIIKHKMSFKAVTMTPVWAKELLGNNHPNNRSKKWKRIAQFSRDMKQGFWVLTHQGIAINEDGILVDGQNRLEAVVDSDCTVPMLLVTGVPHTAMVAADYTASRTVADSARISGKGFEIMEGSWGATARRMMSGMIADSMLVSHQEIISFIDMHKVALTFAFEVLPNNKRGITGPELRAVVARSWYHKRNRVRVGLFCKYIMDGMVDCIATDAAVIKLRNWMLETVARKSCGLRTLRNQVYAKTEAALELFINEETAERLGQTKVELFPLPEENEKLKEPTK